MGHLSYAPFCFKKSIRLFFTQIYPLYTFHSFSYHFCQSIRWQSAYRELDLVHRLSALTNQVMNVENGANCEESAETLSDQLNKWLRSPSFTEVTRMLIRQIRPEDDVRILLQSNDPILHRLPWHLWDLFDDSKAEFAWSTTSYMLNKPIETSNKNRVLVILGSSEGINIEADRKMLEGLPNAEVKFLVQPKREELSEKLWKDKWDILFFAGHSDTQLETGRIYINETESLQMNELHSALRNAVQSGLKLAIFNSCDGLGLARSLSQLHIPQVIVMREPIPDAVAQTFLKYFLESFSNGNSLYASVGYARGRLEDIQHYFPCASWLPIICQNPAENPLIWKKTSEINRPPRFFKNLKKIILHPVTIVIIILLLLGGFYNYFFVLPPQLEYISSGEQILIKESEINTQKKKAGVQAFAKKNWSEAIEQFNEHLSLKKNDPEARIYLNNAIAENSGKGYRKIGVSVPIAVNPNVAQEILRGVAQAQDEINNSRSRNSINGKFLKVVIASDDNKAGGSVDKIAVNFVNDPDILAVIGHNSTGASLAAATTYKNKLLAISPTSNGDDLSYFNYYRTLPSIEKDAQELVKYAVSDSTNKKRWQRIAICSAQEDPSSQSLKEKFIKEFQKFQGSIYESDKPCYFPTKDSEKNVTNAFRPDRIISALNNVDALLLLPNIDNIDPASSMAKSNKDRKIPLIGSSAMYTNETLKNGKGDVEGMVVPTIWHYGFDFAISFAKSSYGYWDANVNWRTATSYDAIQVIIAGLKNNPDPNRKNLMEFVSSLKLDVESSAGIKNGKENNKIIFNPKGDRDAKIRLLKIVENKKTDTGYDFRPLDENFNLLPELTERK